MGGRVAVVGHGVGRGDGALVDPDRIAIDEREINLPLARDIDSPPFMHVAMAETRRWQITLKEKSRAEEHRRLRGTEAVPDNGTRRRHPNFLCMVGREAKASLVARATSPLP